MRSDEYKLYRENWLDVRPEVAVDLLQPIGLTLSRLRGWHDRVISQRTSQIRVAVRVHSSVNIFSLPTYCVYAAQAIQATDRRPNAT